MFLSYTYSIEPTFEVHKANILAAANCTSCVLIEEVDADGKKRRTHLGSAFFVAENLLITAGHNIVGVSGRVTRIWITSPGREHVQRGQIAQRKLPTIDCKVVGTIYKRNGDHSKDIAILDSGSFRHSSYLPLSSLVPLANAEVHVVGYPGEIRYEWIETHSGLTSHLEGKEEAMRLLPNGRLTVTRGTTEAGSDTLPYHISTCPGMGGSCVLYNGDVIGKTQLAHSYQIGVHIGQYDKNIQNLTMALTFSGDEIQRFLRKHRLTIK